MLSIRKAEIADANLLLALSKKTFYDSFFHLNDAADMDLYSATAFTLQKIENEINSIDSSFYFAVYEHSIVGYLKLNFNDAQTEFKDSHALEIERIYVLHEHHGKHLGSRLLEFALQTAETRKLAYVWLGVWDRNYPAIRFYERKGFKTIGSHEFLLGNDLQTDILMKREI